MPRVSIIVPIYNVSDYLDECLASALGQTLGDLEVVCVDDGSTDGSGDLADTWARRDGRVRVVHKPNGGLSSARNAGVDAATGELVFFLDADDALEGDALERISGAFDRTGADVVTFGAHTFPGPATPWLERCLSPREVTYDGFAPSLLFDEASTPFAWRTACRLDWLEGTGIRFAEDVPYAEDSVWHFSLYPASRVTALVPDRVYRYRTDRGDSLMSSQAKGSERRVTDHMGVVEHVFQDWEEAGYLDRWGAELVGWSISYALYATLRQPPEVRGALVPRFATLYHRHVTPRLEGLGLSRSERAMVGLAASVGPDGRSSWGTVRESLACISWRLHRYGLVDLVQTLTGRGGSRSGSGE